MARTDQRALPVALIVIAAVLVVARGAWRAPAAKASLIRWVTPAEGLALAKTTGKPLLYDFTAEWCGPCHQLDEAVFRDPRLAAAINDRFIAVRVTDRRREEGQNSPEVAALQMRYSVRAFPTVIVADARGFEQGRMEGLRGRDYFERMMGSVR